MEKNWDAVFDFMDKDFDMAEFVATADVPYVAGPFMQDYSNNDFISAGD